MLIGGTVLVVSSLENVSIQSTFASLLRGDVSGLESPGDKLPPDPGGGSAPGDKLPPEPSPGGHLRPGAAYSPLSKQGM